MLILRKICTEERDDVFPQDSSVLNEQSINEFKGLTKSLLEQNGKPDYVFISPYTAARKSVEDLDLNIIPDPEIGKYMTDLNALLNRDTEKLLPVIDHDIDDFKSRVTFRFRRLVQIATVYKIWVITHQDVLRQIAILEDIDGLPRGIATNYHILMTC